MRYLVPIGIGLVLAIAALTMALSHRQQVRAREAMETARTKAEDILRATQESLRHADAERGSDALPEPPARRLRDEPAPADRTTDSELAGAVRALTDEMAALREDLNRGFGDLETALIAATGDRVGGGESQQPGSEGVAAMVLDGITILNRGILELEAGGQSTDPAIDLDTLYAARKELSEVRTLDQLVEWRVRYPMFN